MSSTSLCATVSSYLSPAPEFIVDKWTVTMVTVIRENDLEYFPSYPGRWLAPRLPGWLAAWITHISLNIVAPPLVYHYGMQICSIMLTMLVAVMGHMQPVMGHLHPRQSKRAPKGADPDPEDNKQKHIFMSQDQPKNH